MQLDDDGDDDDSNDDGCNLEHVILFVIATTHI